MKRSTDPVLSSIDSYQTQQQQVEKVVMAQHITARKAKNESRKLLFQTILIIIVTLGLLAGFIFVIVPGTIRIAGSLTGISGLPQGDTTPPRIPTYSAPPAATKDSSIEISGYGEPNSTVVVVLNGQENAREKVSETGDFKVSLDLLEGDNSFSIYSVDEAENESNLGRQHSVVFDKTAPELEWESPEDEVTITNLRERNITVRGKVDDPRAKVYLNDRLLFMNNEGSFDGSYQLSEGENTLTIKVFDEAGNETEEERKVNYRP